MRITAYTLFSQLTTSLQKNLEKLSRLNSNLASGKRIESPSDDIVGLIRSMDYKISINYNEQYKRNIIEAKNYLEFSEDIMYSVNDSLIRAKELAISGASGDLNHDDRLIVAREVAQLRDHILNLSNTKFSGRYIFGGYKTDIQPFDSLTYAYNGDDGIINITIDKDSLIALNVPGSSAFSHNGISYAKMLDDLRIALENNDTDSIRASLDNIDKALNQTNSVITDIGSRLNRLDDQINRLDDSTLNLKTVLSDTEDADIATIVTEIAKAQTAVEALRASSARILSQSLLDFLR